MYRGTSVSSFVAAAAAFLRFAGLDLSAGVGLALSMGLSRLGLSLGLSRLGFSLGFGLVALAFAVPPRKLLLFAEPEEEEDDDVTEGAYTIHTRVRST